MPTTSTTAADLPYRPCAGVVLFNRNAQVFVGCRIDTSVEAWQLPQGGIDKGEDARDAAIRELEEETGIKQAHIIAEIEDWLTYDLPDELIGKALKGKYRGQKQRWFAMMFDGEDADVTLQTKHPEFNAWKWVELEELPALIVPFKKALYEQIVEGFTTTRNALRASSRQG